MSQNEKHLSAVIEKTATGFSAYFKSPEVPGATTATSLDGVKENLEELRDLQVEYLKEQGKEFAALENADIKIELDLGQFFEYFDFINKSALAQRLKLNKSLFRRYTKGLAPMGDKRVQDITTELNRIGEELKSVSLV